MEDEVDQAIEYGHYRQKAIIKNEIPGIELVSDSMEFIAQ